MFLKAKSLINNVWRSFLELQCSTTHPVRDLRSLNSDSCHDFFFPRFSWWLSWSIWKHDKIPVGWDWSVEKYSLQLFEKFSLFFRFQSWQQQWKVWRKRGTSTSVNFVMLKSFASKMRQMVCQWSSKYWIFFMQLRYVATYLRSKVG